MLLGRRPFPIGDTRQFKVDYQYWLAEGATLVSATVTADSDAMTVSAVIAEHNYLTFSMAGSPEVNADFTVSVQILNSRGEIKNDTIQFFAVSP